MPKSKSSKNKSARNSKSASKSKSKSKSKSNESTKVVTKVVAGGYTCSHCKNEFLKYSTLTYHGDQEHNGRPTANSSSSDIAKFTNNQTNLEKKMKYYPKKSAKKALDAGVHDDMQADVAI